MTETSTLNFQYPSLHAITSYIVATAVSSMLKHAYEAHTRTAPVALVEWVCDVFNEYPFEESAPDVRLQVMRELEYIGFSW